MGSKGSQTTTTTGSQQYTPNQPVQGVGSNALLAAQTAASAPFSEPAAPVAGFTPQQYQAFDLTNNLQYAAQPYFNTGAAYLNQSAQPISAQEVANYYNPMAQNVTAQMQNIFGQQQQATTGQLTQAAGGVGADRIAVGQSELANQQSLAAGQTYAGLYQSALQAAQQQQQMEAGAGYGLAQMGPSVEATQANAINQLLGTGGLQQSLNQAQLNSLYQQQLAQIAYPFQTAQYLAGVTGSLAPALGGTTTGNQQTTSPSPSLLAQILGLGTAGIGAAGSIGNSLTSSGYNPFSANYNGNTASSVYTGADPTSYGDPSLGWRGGGVPMGKADGGSVVNIVPMLQPNDLRTQLQRSLNLTRGAGASGYQDADPDAMMNAAAEGKVRILNPMGKAEGGDVTPAQWPKRNPPWRIPVAPDQPDSVQGRDDGGSVDASDPSYGKLMDRADIADLRNTIPSAQQGNPLAAEIYNDVGASLPGYDDGGEVGPEMGLPMGSPLTSGQGFAAPGANPRITAQGIVPQVQSQGQPGRSMGPSASFAVPGLFLSSHPMGGAGNSGTSASGSQSSTSQDVQYGMDAAKIAMDVLPMLARRGGSVPHMAVGGVNPMMMPPNMQTPNLVGRQRPGGMPMRRPMMHMDDGGTADAISADQGFDTSGLTGPPTFLGQGESPGLAAGLSNIGSPLPPLGNSSPAPALTTPATAAPALTGNVPMPQPRPDITAPISAGVDARTQPPQAPHYPTHPTDPTDPNYDPKLDPGNPQYNPNDPRLVFADNSQKVGWSGPGIPPQQVVGQGPTGGGGSPFHPGFTPPYPQAQSDQSNWGQQAARSPWMALVKAGAAMASTRGPIGTVLASGLAAGAGELDQQRKSLQTEEGVNEKALQLWEEAQRHLDSYNKLTANQKEEAQYHRDLLNQRGEHGEDTEMQKVIAAHPEWPSLNEAQRRAILQSEMPSQRRAPVDPNTPTSSLPAGVLPPGAQMGSKDGVRGYQTPDGVFHPLTG